MRRGSPCPGSIGGVHRRMREERPGERRPRRRSRGAQTHARDTTRRRCAVKCLTFPPPTLRGVLLLVASTLASVRLGTNPANGDGAACIAAPIRHTRACSEARLPRCRARPPSCSPPCRCLPVVRRWRARLPRSSPIAAPALETARGSAPTLTRPGTGPAVGFQVLQGERSQIRSGQLDSSRTARRRLVGNPR